MKVRLREYWKDVLFALVAILAVAMAIFLQNRYDDGFHAWVGSLGIPGIVAIGFFSNAPVIAPIVSVGLIPLILDIANQHNVYIIIGLYAASATLGESTAYLVGIVGKDVAHLEHRKIYKWLKTLLGGKWTVPIIFGFAVVPIPFLFDIASLLLGGIRYPYGWYAGVTFMGRCVRYAAFVYFGREICDNFGTTVFIRLFC